MKTPLDLQRGAPPISLPAQNPQNYPQNVRKILDKIHQEVREQIKSSAEYMKRKYDQQLTIAPFKAGDSVWYYNRYRRKGKTTKLWQGPYIVVDVINDCVARMQDPITNKFLMVHMDKLATYRASKNPLKAA